MSKKPRSDAKLKNLSREIQASIIARMTAVQGKNESTSIESVIEWIKAECDVQTSAGALSEFWSWYHLRERVEARERRSQDLQQVLRQPKYGLSEEEVITIGNRHFLEQGVDSGDAKLYVAIVDRVLAKREGETKAKFKARDLDLKERRVVMLEKKAEQADQAKKVNADSNLTAEEYRERMRAIFKK